MSQITKGKNRRNIDITNRIEQHEAVVEIIKRCLKSITNRFKTLESDDDIQIYREFLLWLYNTEIHSLYSDKTYDAFKKMVKRLRVSNMMFELVRTLRFHGIKAKEPDDPQALQGTLYDDEIYVVLCWVRNYLPYCMDEVLSEVPVDDNVWVE